ncbi:hypothetical protein F2Q70_00005258 [Brassica cretica]|uniref:Uncharacterized protein n=1 Tax=Brassica cretica TaxID=69181 RepID=A0A8S9IK90_BRACR|nr:hypothetical protein F2Q70_00005258 [Brassica cretica]
MERVLTLVFNALLTQAASTGKHQDTGKEQLWKEKHLRPLKIVDQQPRDATSASVGETNKLRSIVTDEASRRHSDQTSLADVVPKARTTTEQPPMNTNVTFRPNSTECFHMEVADDLISPYNALKIDALNEHDIENEEEIPDADMEDPIMGTELALMEDDDLLGDDLASTNFGEIEAAKEADEKALTRSVTRTLFMGSQQGNQRRASPRINSKPAPQVNVPRARRGAKPASSKKATPGAGTQQKGMVDAKYPPHLHQ